MDRRGTLSSMRCGVTIRRMREEDVQQAAAIERMIFSDPWTEEGFGTALKVDGTCYLAAVIAALDGPGQIPDIRDTGRIIQETMHAAQDTGQAIQEAGRAAQDTGQAIQEAGRAVQDTGQAIQEAGISMRSSGQIIWGQALIQTVTGERMKGEEEADPVPEAGTEGKADGKGFFGDLVGYCGMYTTPGEGEIVNVAVHPAFRRRGIARGLLEALIREGRSRGVSRFILEVRRGNHQAIALYEGLGFQTLGLRRNFYEHPREDALVMCRECG